jgi:hypothetical protein
VTQVQLIAENRASPHFAHVLFGQIVAPLDSRAIEVYDAPD